MNPSVKTWCAFQTHKPKETPSDCADAWHVSDDNRRVAVADGVTRSLYPGVFAETLVYWFCRKTPDLSPDWEAWLAPVRERWLEAAETRVAKLGWKRNPAYINNRERLLTRVPGAATFVGVEFFPEQGKVKTSIIGDSCLFIFAGGTLAEALPYTSSAEFDNQPKAFLSYAGQSAAEPVFRELPMRAAHYVLATDALAKWIFEQHESGRNPLPDLLALKTEKEFLAFVDSERERDSHALNDDVTLVIMQAGGALPGTASSAAGGPPREPPSRHGPRERPPAVRQGGTPPMPPPPPDPTCFWMAAALALSVIASMSLAKELTALWDDGARALAAIGGTAMAGGCAALLCIAGIDLKARKKTKPARPPRRTGGE